MKILTLVLVIGATVFATAAAVAVPIMWQLFGDWRAVRHDRHRR